MKCKILGAGIKIGYKMIFLKQQAFSYSEMRAGVTHISETGVGITLYEKLFKRIYF